MSAEAAAEHNAALTIAYMEAMELLQWIVPGRWKIQHCYRGRKAEQIRPFIERR
jgi:hypothetical protein